MFNNPQTLWIEILAVTLVVTFLGVILGRYIYKKVHHLPTGECECCHKSKKQLLEEYHKEFDK